MAADGAAGAAGAPIVETHRLFAGPLSMLFEHGQILYVRYGEREILRRIYMAVRDPEWVTLPTRLFDLSVIGGKDDFRVSFLATNERGPICFQWRGVIEGNARGELSYSMSGLAESDFFANRIGLCILHPIAECREKPCRIETVDGGSVPGAFPGTIEPQLAFANMRALSYEVAPGLGAALRFEGDTFETEDQRQWGDASLKTYSRPVALPKPFEVTAGHKIEQSVSLRVSARGPAPPAFRDSTDVLVSVDPARTYRLPAIGLGLPAGVPAHSARERKRLASLSLSHLRVDVVPMRQTAPEELERATAESKALDLPLQMTLVVSRTPQRELGRFVDTVDTSRPRLVSAVMSPLLDSVPTVDVRRAVRQIMSHTIADVPVGTGVFPYFTELNRNRDVIERAKFLCVPLTPLAHLSDDRTLVENLVTPSWMAETFRAFAPPDLPLEFGRVTLRKQPRQGGTPPPVVANQLPPHVDARQASSLLAGWTAAHVGVLARAGIERVTYFETIGWLGVMPGGDGSPDQIDRLGPVADGMVVFPAFHAFADVGEFRGAEVLHAESGNPLAIGALVLRRGNNMRALVANLGDMPRVVTLKAPITEGRLRRLNEDTLIQATREPERFRTAEMQPWTGGPIPLEPHELVTIDGVTSDGVTSDGVTSDGVTS